MTKNGILDVKRALEARKLYKALGNKSAVGRAMKKHEKQVRRWLAIPSDRLEKLSTDR